MGSKHVFLSELVGIEKLNSPTDKVDGISTSQSSVHLKFKSPVKNVLELLGFGVFGIVHPSSYSKSDGEWKAVLERGYLSSGPYSIIEVGKEHIVMKLREDYPKSLFSEKAYSEIEFVFDLTKRDEVSIYRGVTGPSQGDHLFFGSGPNQILYFHAHSWKNENSPLSSIQVRRMVRDRVQQLFELNGGKASSSFFPELTPDLEAVRTTKSGEGPNFSSFDGQAVTFYDIRPALAKVTNIALDSLESTLVELGLTPKGVKGFSFEEIVKNKNPNLESYSLDIGFYSTGLAISDPDSDIRLMFSKEGIWLPDISGKIKRELAKNKISVSRVNQELYDQAVIWPVTHYSLGIWARPSLDLSDYNTQLPLGELQWIGAK